MLIKKILVFVTLIDLYGGVWMILGAGRQWHANEKQKLLTLPTGEAYAAIAGMDIDTGRLVEVGAPLDLDVTTNTILTHQYSMLPQHVQAQAELWLYVSTIEDPLLKRFAQDILSDTKIITTFYHSRASQDFHHKKKGELFLHSMEVATTSARLAKLYGLSKRTQDCVFVGGLLHDIGKTLMFYNIDQMCEKGVGGQHEAFNFMVLADYLEVLKNSDKVLFEAVSAMLSPISPRKLHCEYIEEAIVRAADRLSAHTYELQTAFEGKAADQLRVKLQYGRIIKRLGTA